jgi:hypothetical protein
MAAQILDLTDELIIEQGSYWAMVLQLAGDLTGATLRGQIKDAYGGKLLADFRYGEFTFDEETNKTQIPVFLNAAQTLQMPVPTDGLWVYDIKLVIPGKDSIRLVQGRANVSRGVTDVAS